MATKRSPNYPSISLENALERARDIYKAEHRNSAPRAALALDLGYNSLNGASTQIIGALTRYGILEKEADGLRISKDAMSFFELPRGERERMEAIERLAYTPKLFQELKDRYPGTLPSEPTVRHYLVTQKEFLPKGANELIRVYRDTLELVSQEKDSYTGEGSESIKAEPVATPPATTEEMPVYTLEPQGRSPMNTETQKAFHIPLAGDNAVQILFSGPRPTTQEDIKKVRSYLELSIDSFPQQSPSTPESDKSDGE